MQKYFFVLQFILHTVHLMHMINPGNRAIIVFLLTVLIVSGIIAVSTQSEQEENDNLIEPEVVTETDTKLVIERQLSPNEVDTDEDGLLDWQEELRGTDKNNPDTDGDGTNDAEEVAADRDPLKPGPEDAITTQEPENPFNVPNYTPGSLTDQVSQNIAVNYFSAKQEDAVTPEYQNELVTRISDDLDQMSVNESVYGYADIVTFPADKEREKTYANNLSVIQITNFSKMAAIPNTNPDLYLATLSTAYQNFSKEVIAEPVSEPLADIHIAIANNFYNFGSILEELGNYAKDPIAGLLALKKYGEIIDSQPRLYEQLKNYLDNSGIIFTEEDPGYLLTRYAETLQLYGQ